MGTFEQILTESNSAESETWFMHNIITHKPFDRHSLTNPQSRELLVHKIYLYL